MNKEDLERAFPRLDEALNGLRDFQRKTVDYVFKRMYLDTPPATRFLVADEVGLGKTKVAQGVIAHALRHLHPTVDRIDIVYVCSNAAIARQNLARLNPFPEMDVSQATRLTLLPLQLRGLQRNHVNMVSFTPGTAIDTTGGGLWRERALIYRMLHQELASELGSTGTPLRNLLQCGVRDPVKWKALVESPEFAPIDESEEGGHDLPGYDPKLALAFSTAVREDKDLFGRLQTAADRFKRRQDDPSLEDSQLRYRVIGELRSRLARVCVSALEPDLVILDEFQRFQELLENVDNPQDGRDESEATEIARALFNYRDQRGNDARVLLLSATPYRMFTRGDEDEDHHKGFLQTFKFLAQGNETELTELRSSLEQHREALSAEPPSAPNPLKTAADVRERLLRRMVRTERVELTHQRDAMLSERRLDAPIDPSLVRAGVTLDQVAGELGVPNPIEYWKSAPYPLSFMKDYELKRALRDAAEHPTDALVKLLEPSSALVLRRDDVKQWRPVDIGTGRLETLAKDTIEAGLWKLLWLPPSLPYVEPSGPYKDVAPTTKALVFSCWNVVPDAVAGLLSYEAERRMFASQADGPRAASTYEQTDARRPLLTFNMERDGETRRAASMMTLALLYPSVTLAHHIDPLEIACNAGDTVSLDQMRATVTEQFERRVNALIAQFGSGDEGASDADWYWALPVMLDATLPRLVEWLDDVDGAIDQDHEATFEDEGDEDLARFAQLFDTEKESQQDDEPRAGKSNYRHHVERLRDLALKVRAAGKQRVPLLGKAPPRLLETLTDLAIASPAVCALRALGRIVGSRMDRDAFSLLASAAVVARGFRTLFNVPETIALLRGTEGDADDSRTPYWRRVLEYCCDGNLQAVLDELVHLKLDDTGSRDKPPQIQVREIARVIAEAMSPRTSNLQVEEIQSRPRAQRIDFPEFKLRCRFAMRYGDLTDERDSSTIRAGVVKEAFNSPFRPFVLATTSIGQEGLDFHHYCHAVYHWNLPTNPVDLEQREGRVHRYKGHAVRRNVAKALGLRALQDKWDGETDPWDCLFAVAKAGRQPGQCDIVPYWIYEVEGGVSVERRVPMLPMSREHGELEKLKGDLATYRLVFGQPRQEDLLAFLQRRKRKDPGAPLPDWRIKMTPPDDTVEP